MISIIVQEFIKVIGLFIISLSLRVLLEINGQTWIKTKSHTVTLVILPLITFIITSVIAGNIALSLGMVGALSIVRFRNPVRSPLELTVYFTVITMGIAASANYMYLFFLAGSIYFLTFLLTLVSFFSKKYFKKSFFISSFSEGNNLSTLEIETSQNIKIIEESKYLKSLTYSKGSSIKYLLASSDFNLLRNFIKRFKDNNLIINYQLNES